MLWVCFLLFAGLFSKDEKKRKRRIWAAVLLLYLLSNSFIVNEFLMAYESKGTSYLDSSYDVGIVLGGFSKKDTFLNRTVFYEANDRLMQALVAYKSGLIKKIMISSGNASILNTRLKEADAVKEYLLKIGIPDTAIIIENKSRNTYENILFSKKVLDSLNLRNKTLIFSSAWHLPRVSLCLNNNLQADLFATHFISSQKRDFSPDILFIPSASALSYFELLLKEWVGYVFYFIKVS